MQTVRDITPTAIRKLVEYDWPGNVRELESVIYRAIILSRNFILEEHELSVPNCVVQGSSLRAEKARCWAVVERDFVTKALAVSEGNISRAARAAQQNRRAFWRLIQKHHIVVNRQPSSGATYLSP